MPKYQVHKTETVTVQAHDEAQAIERANIEFMKNPDAGYSVTRLTPKHNLHRIMAELEEAGLSVYLDDYKNNSHDFIRLDTKKVTEGWRYVLSVSLDDDEEYDGNGYGLMTDDAVDIAQFPHLDANTIAMRVLQQLTAWEEQNPEPVEMQASLEELAELLTRMGYTVSVESQEWRGMPSWLTIGETVDFYADGTPYQAPEFTLYQNLTEKGDAVDGTGYHLSRGDDEADTVLQIPNESAFRVASQIVWAMAQEAKGVTA